MYKLVIADDEIDFRGRIIKIIESTNIGFELVGNYENGLDALDGINTNCPDVLIADIKMPFMDGITLIKTIRKDFPLLKAIIVSGFDEFDYAQEAIDLNVTSFITKPITLEKMEKVLVKLKEELDNESKERELKKELVAFKEDNMKQVISFELNNLVTKYTNLEQTKLNLDKFDVKLDYANVVCCYVDLDESNHEYNTSILIEDILESTLKNYETNIFIRGYANIVLVKSNTIININELSYKLNECILRVKQETGKKVSIGVSLNVDSYINAYNQSKKSLESRVILKGEQVFVYDLIDNVNCSFEEDIKEFKTLLINNNIIEVEVKLNCIKEKITKSKIDLNNFNSAITNILNITIQKCQKPDALYKLHENILIELLNLKNIEDSFNFLIQIIKEVVDINKSLIVNQKDLKLNQIINYIESHYKENLVLDDIADEMGITSNYICNLLKKYKNTTFVKYLTKIRMEKAIELLQTKQYKIVDVSIMVGYDDPFYFSHCFKRYTTKSPKDFLNSL